MTKLPYRVAPPGFSPEQWATFNQDGITIIEAEDFPLFLDRETGLDHTIRACTQLTLTWPAANG